MRLECFDNSLHIIPWEAVAAYNKVLVGRRDATIGADMNGVKPFAGVLPDVG